MSQNTDTSDQPGPLSGLRVLELGVLIAGPFAGRLLADFGAEVIKVEHPDGGDPLRRWGMAPHEGDDSLWSLVQQRGKRSVALDLHEPESQRIVRELAAQSDVVLENFRPGRLEEWGLGPDRLREQNPGLVVVRISGYGQTGPLSDQPGFGTIAEAAAGLRFITGDPERPPTRAAVSLGDSIASLHAVIGLLLALRERDQSGRGQDVDVALTEAVFSMLEGILPEFSYFGAVRKRTGNIAHNSAPTDAYPTGDGALICIGANTTSLFRKLFHLMGRSDLAEDPRFQDNRGRVAAADELNGHIADWTRERESAELQQLLREHRIPASKVNSIADIAREDHFRERGMIEQMTDPRLDKPLDVPGVMPRLSRTPGRIRHLGPGVGQDTEQVLSELGRDAPSNGPHADPES